MEKTKKKKKIREWGLIDLFETSVVGIGSYPDAHMNANSFSLVKALSESNRDTQLNKYEAKMTEEKEVQKSEQPKTQAVENSQDSSETSEEEKVEEVDNEEKEEKVEESDNEEKEETEDSEEEEKKSFTAKEIKGLISKAVEDAMSSASTERGLVEKEAEGEKLKDKSLGELALNMCK